MTNWTGGGWRFLKLSHVYSTEEYVEVRLRWFCRGRATRRNMLSQKLRNSTKRLASLLLTDWFLTDVSRPVVGLCAL